MAIIRQLELLWLSYFLFYLRYKKPDPDDDLDRGIRLPCSSGYNLVPSSADYNESDGRFFGQSWGGTPAEPKGKRFSLVMEEP